MQSRSFRVPLVILAIGIAFTISTLARTEGRPPPVRMQATSYPPSITPTTSSYPLSSPTAAAPGGATRTTSPTARTATPRGASTPTLTRIAEGTPTERAQILEPTVAPSPTPTATLELSGNVVCVPGTEITIVGDGPPRAPILLYFGQRTVGGGSVRADGSFALPLTIGVERPGDHSVSVRVRGSGQALIEFTCSVPPVTPTPLPGRRAIP